MELVSATTADSQGWEPSWGVQSNSPNSSSRRTARDPRGSGVSSVTGEGASSVSDWDASVWSEPAASRSVASEISSSLVALR
uniref:ORF_02L n=1 Tax=Human herpesvirus 1 (strain R15) TaxID=36345 RepID=Q6VB60_HHV1R|nr:ORF_02L [Human alphaherpesvirus 1 strain R-15]